MGVLHGVMRWLFELSGCILDVSHGDSIAVVRPLAFVETQPLLGQSVVILVGGNRVLQSRAQLLLLCFE